MTKSSKHGKKEPNLWREAYKSLYAENGEKEHMQKVQAKLRKRLNQPDLDLKTDEGYNVMVSFISKQGSKMESKKRPERFSKVSQNMIAMKDLFGAGAAVGGPYVAIPVAALFMVFSVCSVAPLPGTTKLLTCQIDGGDLHVGKRCHGGVGGGCLLLLRSNH
jgi:hypothetical protein